MGNCCCPESDDTPPTSRPATSTFQGQGHRLGTADEATHLSAPIAVEPMVRDDSIPEPVYDANLSEEDRKRIRADRAAAAEARLKKQTGKKKATKPSEPLRGPNSEPLMRWNA